MFSVEITLPELAEAGFAGKQPARGCSGLLCGISVSSLRVDGGMVVNELLMQFQSDLVKVPVVRPSMIETTALGAAYAAGLAVGYWKDLNDLKQNWGIDKTWTPNMEAAKREKLIKYWKKAVTRSFDWEEED